MTARARPPGRLGGIVTTGVAAGLLLLAGVFGAPLAARAQILRNSGAGMVGRAALDTTRATVMLTRTLPQVPPSVAEITPSRIEASARAVEFELDVKPTIVSGSPGVTRLDITLPAGFSGVVVHGVRVSGTPLSEACPIPGPGRYCLSRAGPIVSITFGTPVLTDLARITVRLTADAPAAPGPYRFGAAVANSGGWLASTEGNANDVAGDANSLTVQVRSAVDALRSTVTADPPVVQADGTAASTITTTLLDAAGRPLPGRTVRLSSSRGPLDTFAQPAEVTDAGGVARGTIRSATVGAAVVTATVTSDSLTLGPQPTVTFTRGLALRLALGVDRERASLGEALTFTVTLANRTAQPVEPVQVAVTLPPAFRYLPGSAAREGAPIADPQSGSPLVFDVTRVPGLVDANGNGIVDPGEAGSVTLRYRAVVGSGATPGTYLSDAIARDLCERCAISNAADVSVEIAPEPVFSLATIIGRVFEDADRDGRQGPDEPGIAGARVALDDGTSALTDRRGLYHFPAVAPGHRLVKLDLHSLPGVAGATSGESRLLTVTSGLLAEGDFGVTFQREIVRVGRPAEPTPQIALEPPYDGDAVGSAGAPGVPGTPGAGSGSDAAATDGAIPMLEATLPPDGARLSSASYPVTGRTSPENVVSVNGQRVPVGADGRFETTVLLPPGLSRVVITATDPAGRVARIERAAEVPRDRVFLVALADGAVGRLQGSGFLRDDLPGDGTLYTEGRVAWYLQGVVRGRYLITSAYDSRIDEFATFFDRVDEDTNLRLMTSLDPDRFYPVYGDSSVTLHDAQRQGRFFLAVESEELQAVVGRAALALEGSELAAFRRTLDGAQVHWRSASRSRYGDPTTSVALVGAQAGQVHVRDELRGTGGSLYYLSHRDIVPGSEQISIAIRDQNTGLVLERIPQQRGADYTIKTLEGRLLFARPVSSVAEAGSLVSREVLAGNPVVIEVDYETRSADLGRSLTGARARRQMGDHLAVGGTWLRDELETTPYELRGVDGELRIGAGSRVAAEAGSSAGVGSRAYASADGGLTFAEATPFDARDGSAWRAAADLDVGEWFGRGNRARVRGYLKQVGPGFVSSGNLAERGTTRAGAGAELNLAAWGRLAMRFDAERREDSLGVATRARSNLFGAQWTRDARRWGLGAEFQSRDVAGADGRPIEDVGLLSGRVWSRFGERLTARAEHQQTLQGTRNDRTTLGLQYQASRRLGFDLRGATGTLGHAAQGGATLTAGGVSLYVNERWTGAPAAAGHATVVGSQAALGASGRVYTEYQWQRLGAGDRDVSLLGVQKQWQPGRALVLSLSGEHGETGTAGQKTRRTAVAGSAGITTASGIRLVTQEEMRFDTGARERRQLLASNVLEARLRGGLTALGRWRWSETRDRQTDRIEARYEEHGVGLAFRPEHGGGPNALARYTRLTDVGPAGSERTAAGGAMDVLSLEGTLDITPWMQWTGKGAARVWRNSPADSGAVRTHSTLVVSRVNTALAGPFGFGVEYRVLAQREAGDRRRGWLNEFTWDPAAHVRVGLGYNFTDFSDDAFSRNDSSVGGWFLRLQGRY